MNYQDFCDEVLSYNQSAHEIPEILEEFGKIRETTLNILNNFHQICERNNIRYQLAYGSLLGAIRDDGQIPWDYDIDVFVPYCEINKLVVALKKELSQDYYFYSPEVSRKCRHKMMRISPVGTRSEAIHVDVFYMVGAPTNKEERKKFGKKIKKLFETRYIKLVNIKEESYGRPKTFIKLIINKLIHFVPPLGTINKEFDKLCTMYDFDSSKYLVSIDGWADHQFFSNTIWDTMLIETSSGVFRVSKSFDAILKEMYGDYNTIPPLDNRIEELIKSYKHIKYIGDNWKKEHYFDK